jgi:chromosome segregation ATPase
MEEKLIQCLNNSLLITMNIRKKPRKFKLNSSVTASKPLIISPPTPKVIKHELSQADLRTKPVFRPKKIIRENNEGIDIIQSESLNQIIIQQQETLKKLQLRSEILERIIKKAEFFSGFSEKEASDLIKLIQEMTKTLLKTSAIEVELGVKSRLFERKNLETASLKNNYTHLMKRSQQSEHELRELREKIKNLSEENTKLQKNSENAKQRYAEVNNKIQTLEESLWIITNTSTPNAQDSTTKLKSAINALLRDAYYYKKEIQAL